MIKKTIQFSILSFITTIILISCSSDHNTTLSFNNTKSITKPKGIYTSSFGNSSALNHNEVNGALIRVRWSDIETNEGVYDFSLISQSVATIKSKNLKWSLGIIAGSDSPDWLTNSFGADFFEITYRSKSRKIPKIWDPKVNEKLTDLASALADEFGNDEDLLLIYVPQMTTNGIEGHFNGITSNELISFGFTAENWINSVKKTAKIFANAFPNKAIAVEVHDIMNDTSIPSKIMTDLWDDDTLNQRVGVGMWWISGKTSYQQNLINVLTNFPGDIYAQVIGKSDQTDRFENNDYTTVFSQAEQIGIRYLELWEYEFINNTFPQEFEKFNNYANTNFE